MFSLSLFLSPSLVENYNSLTCFLIATRREGANFYFESVGMRRGDSFVFYHRDVETANTNSAIAFEKLRKLKEKTCANDENKNKNGDTIMVDNVFGGLIFSCRSRVHHILDDLMLIPPHSLSTCPGSQLLECSAKGKLDVALQA